VGFTKNSFDDLSVSKPRPMPHIQYTKTWFSDKLITYSCGLQCAVSLVWAFQKPFLPISCGWKRPV